MAAVLLDTDVFSFAFKRDTRAALYAPPWIAATAIRYNLPLLTHNAADYAGVAGLQLVSHS